MQASTFNPTLQKTNSSTASDYNSTMTMNSSSSIKSLSSGEQSEVGAQKIMDFVSYLLSLSSDDKKKLISSFLEAIDDESLTFIGKRIDVEKKSRKKKDGLGKKGRVTSVSGTDLSGISESVGQSSPTQTAKSSKLGGLFRRTTKVNKKDSSKQNGNSKDDNSSLDANKDVTNDVQVDEDGFIIRKPSTFESQNKKEEKFYSDSDTDSDQETNKKAIRVVIKPINGATSNGPRSGSIAELQRTVQGLSISPSILSTRGRDSAINRSKRRQMSASGFSDQNGQLKRSLSQNVYRAGTVNDSTSFFSDSPSNGSQHQNSTNSSNVFFDNSILSENSSSRRNARNETASHSEDRYAALSSLFTDVIQESNDSSPDVKTNGELQSTDQANNFAPNLAKSMSSSSVMGPPLALPKPPSKRPSAAQIPSSPGSAWSTQNVMTRCKSYGSLTSSEFRMTPISLNSVGSSRGPSPLTIGFNDTIPVAIALQESINAKFRGIDETRCLTQMFGSLKIAFPSGIVQALTNNPNPAALSFRIINGSRIEKLHPNQEILSQSNESSIVLGNQQSQYSFEVNVHALINYLRRLLEQSPSARYYNIDVIKYQLKCFPGAKSCPLQIVTHWKCEAQSTGIKIEYKYNPSALSTLEPLKNVTISVKIDANVTDVQGKPQPTWNPSTRHATWSLPSLSRNSDDSGLGSLRAKFDISNGPSKPSPVTVQFLCLDATLSGIDFELTSPGFRVSLVKKQVMTGRYTSEVETPMSYAV